jgi:3-oxoacyl-[acyl-carrier-protein] synthase II
MDDSVVITGAGLICSIGKSTHEAWNGLISGRHGIRPLEGFEIKGFDCQYAAQVYGLDPSDIGIHPKDARIMDKHSSMLLKCARDAFIASRLDHTPIEKEDIGFFAGLGMVDYKIEDLMPAVVKSVNENGELDYDAFYSEAYREIYPLWPLSMLNNISFCQVAIHLDIRGENIVFSPHADSGAQALVEGMKTVIGQRSRVVLAGGVSEKVSPLSMARGHFFGILNTTEKDGEMLCRPFASERKGTILGEGCGVLALELRSSADKRGIPYSTKITGYGFACNSRQDNEGATSKAIACGMKRALERAALEPSAIDVVIANGDGTYHADKNEIDAINHIFSDCIGNVQVFSSKGALGHLFAAAPAVDVILGMFMINEGIIPATLNAVPLDDTIKFNITNGSPLERNPQRIMINCQSYEGQCASLIIEDIHTRSRNEISLL